MKNRLLTLLSAVLSAGAVSAAAPQQLIDIRTDDVSIVLAAQPGGEVYFRHFGGRIDDPAPLAAAPTTGPTTWPIPQWAGAISANRPCASPTPTGI